MKKEIEWIFSGFGTSVVFGILGVLSTVLLYLYRKKKARINFVIEKYSQIYNRNGLRLECLLPSGIHNLKSNREITKFFDETMRIEPNHPLREWEPAIRRIGYKTFFNHVFLSGKTLNKNTIEDFIGNFDG